MARYFFNVHDGTNLQDHEGLELPDLRAVRSEAIMAAGEILRDVHGALGEEEWVMEVTRESGQLVLTLRFSATQHVR